MLTDERIQKKAVNIIVGAVETTIFESGDVSAWSSKMLWIKNTGGSVLETVKIQACPNPSSITPDWTSIDTTTFANLAVNIIKYLPIEISLRAIRVRAATPFGAISAIAAAPTAGGTGYVVNDVLTVNSGSADATVVVTGVNVGVVTTVALVSGGTGGYTVGTGKATTGGSGTGCTINITAVSGTTVSIWLDVQE